MIYTYNDDLIYGKVSKAIRKRTKENMEVYCMGFYDSFEEAVRELAKEGTELWKAWYHSDFRKFIPAAYNAEYLNFNEYPLRY